jgi:hypothetical protein
MQITLTEEQIKKGYRVIERREGYEEKLIASYAVPPNVTDGELWEAVNSDTACEIPGVDVFYT